MRLKDKGAFKSAPILNGSAEAVLRAIQSWPDVISATHWLLGSPGVVDGTDFYVGEAELGHIHLDGSIHLALTKPLRDLLVGRGLAGPFRWSAAWVVAPIRSVAEADSATWLFRLAYDRLRGASDHEIRDRILSHGSDEVGVATSRF